MVDLDFMSDDVIRRMVARDRDEMDRALSGGLPKSVMLLAGSILEAILVDFFLAYPPGGRTPARVTEAALAQLLSWAADDGLVSKRVLELSTVVRDYRNLIHPGKEYRLRERIDMPSATVAASLVAIVTRELQTSLSERRGYTAEAAIAKVKIDPSSPSIFRHMVGQMTAPERVRLFRTLPKECEESGLLPEVVENFVRLHRALADSIPEAVVREEAGRVADFLNHRNREDTLRFLRFFGKHLPLVEARTVEAIRQYLVQILMDAQRDLLGQVEAIGPNQLGRLFTDEPGHRLLIQVIRTRLRRGRPEDDPHFLRILEGIWPSLSVEQMEACKLLARKMPGPRASSWATAMEKFIPF